MTVQGPGHLHCTKAVSVVLDDCENWAPTRERPDGGRVGPQRRCIDFDPRVEAPASLLNVDAGNLSHELASSCERSPTGYRGGGGQKRTPGRSHGLKLRRPDR